MKQHTHPCSAIGCNVQIPLTRAFCTSHWSRLPLPLKQRINSHYEKWRTAKPADKERMHAKLRESIREAMQLLRGEEVKV